MLKQVSEHCLVFPCQSHLLLQLSNWLSCTLWYSLPHVPITWVVGWCHGQTQGRIPPSSSFCNWLREVINLNTGSVIELSKVREQLSKNRKRTLSAPYKERAGVISISVAFERLAINLVWRSELESLGQSISWFMDSCGFGAHVPHVPHASSSAPMDVPGQLVQVEFWICHAQTSGSHAVTSITLL